MISKINKKNFYDIIVISVPHKKIKSFKIGYLKSLEKKLYNHRYKINFSKGTSRMATVKKNFWSGKNGPLMIAEIGGNHEGSFSFAKKLTNEAIMSGADVVKFHALFSSIVNKKISPDRNKHFKISTFKNNILS